MDRGGEYVVDAGIMTLARNLAQSNIKRVCVLCREFGNRFNSKRIEVSKCCFSNIPKPSK